ncbi:peptide/nickel transport system ATP-binding protein [Variovorax boronicumulans]|uniref:ABC transporter ATP-binding protein n=1 Tax=Variovorax boronicumulans TaxID=436515 RepID=UPI0024744C9B|nr:ATP-binding cassette domain-containing protein [Variovorax boronicumulans]MDH6165459.1 peptide/nickel transport system ATP-binding protein [Variovorax boronicumulans]
MSASVLLAVENLSVHVDARPLLRDVSFSLRPGEALTLLGESGAGKSLLAQAVMGNLPAALRAGGRVVLDGVESRAEDARARRPRWGRTLALLPQEPALALDPLMRIAPQLSETHELVRGAAFEEAESAALRDLGTAGLAASARQYPWQLSGGMAQRAAAAVACAGGARILLADEPTKGLDGHWRDHAVAMLQAVQRAGGCVVVITHDLRVAEALGGQLIVLRHGEVVEQGDARTVLANPRHAFTRRLVAADPAHWPRRRTAVAGAPVLSAQGLSKGFGGKPLFDGIDLQIRAGERFVVQGPSGTGKSTLGNVLLGLLPADRGMVRRAEGLLPTAFQKLYQDPVASFAPRISLAQSLRDVAARHRCAWPAVLQQLDRLGMPADLLARRPAEVSGGELQRIALARVLTVQPALVFADEPTSRLDPVSQQEAMGVLLDALDERGAALMLVTHDDDIANAVATNRWSFAGA